MSYYDTNGKTLFRFGCWTHYEMDVIYPGGAPKQDFTEASITIANGKTQMDFAGRIDGPGGPVPRVGRRTPRCSTRRTSAIPNLTRTNGARWKIAS